MIRVFCTHKIVNGEYFEAELIYAKDIHEAYKIANAKGIIVDGFLQFESDEYGNGRAYDNN